VSYPEELYRGSTGEVSATYRPAGHDAEVSIGSAVALGYLATGASTAGRFGLYRWDAGPRSGGARAAGRYYTDEEWTALCQRHDNYFVG
jgi:hypothetical protein